MRYSEALRTPPLSGREIPFGSATEGRGNRTMEKLRLPTGVTCLEAHKAVCAREFLSGADFGAYCRRHGFSASTVEAWAGWFREHPDGVDRGEVDAALSELRKARRELACKTEELRKREREIARIDKALADAALMLSLSKKSAGAPGGQGKLISAQDRQKVVELVRFGMDSGLSQRQACEALGITPRTLQNWRHAPEGDRRLEPRRQVPNYRQIPPEEAKRIVERFCRPDVRDISLTQAYYRLLDDHGEYLCSLSTLYRIFRGLDPSVRPARAREAAYSRRPEAMAALRPNEVWMWDLAHLRTGAGSGRFFSVWMLSDMWSRALVAVRAFEPEAVPDARRFLGEIFQERHARPEKVIVYGEVHAGEVGSFLSEAGVVFSGAPRRVRENARSDSLFRTLNYSSGDFPCPEEGFKDLASAQRWLDAFAEHFNEHHRHQGIGMVTPGQRLRGEEAEVLRRRGETIARARKRSPERWIRGSAARNRED